MIATVRNNGLTSFIPPCFSWEIINPSTGRLIDTASELCLDMLGLSAAEADKLREQLFRGGIQVEADVQETPPVFPSKIPGRRLIVKRIVR